MNVSVQFSCSVVSDSLQPHGLQHTRPPCPSPTPRVYSNSCPLSQWCHSAISSSVIPLSCPQSFPASGSFQMSQLLAWGDQSIGVSASASVLPMNTQDWSPLGWTGWISLQSKGLSNVSFRMDWLDILAVQGTLKCLLQHHSSIASILALILYSPTLTSVHDSWKNYIFDYMDFCWQIYVSAF